MKLFSSLSSMPAVQTQNPINSILQTQGNRTQWKRLPSGGSSDTIDIRSRERGRKEGGTGERTLPPHQHKIWSTRPVVLASIKETATPPNSLGSIQGKISSKCVPRNCLGQTTPEPREPHGAPSAWPLPRLCCKSAQAQSQGFPGAKRKGSNPADCRMRLSCPICSALLAFSCILLAISHASDFPCSEGVTKEIKLDPANGKEDRILPQIHAVEASKSRLHCRWEITPTVNSVLLVISGLDVETIYRRRPVRSIANGSEGPRMRYFVEQSETQSECLSRTSRDWKPVDLETLQVLLLPRGSSLIAKFERSPRDPRVPPGLHVKLVERGFCSREMVNYQHNCYRISPARRTLRQEIQEINGDGKLVKLASFSNSVELRSFFYLSQRTRVGSGLETRSKVPLNLTEPVRIGMFLHVKSRRIFYMHRGPHDCSIELFQDPENLKFSAPQESSSLLCGSLRADAASGRELVEFRDCSESLPALISFADSASSRCSNCSAALDAWMRRSNPTEVEGKRKEVEIIISKAALVLIVTASVIALVLVKSKFPWNRQFTIHSSGHRRQSFEVNEAASVSAIQVTEPLTANGEPQKT